MPRYFTTFATVEELKANYRLLVRKYHPDCGGADEDMKAINAEYEELFEAAKRGSRQQTEDAGCTWNENAHTVDDGFREIIINIASVPGVEVEICGSWIWVTGDTKPVKDTLKEEGFKWAVNKKAWYWHSGEYRRKNRKTFSMDEIRDMHGSDKVFGRRAAMVAG